MSKLKKNQYLVYSVFSTELQDYPYYPFIAKNHNSALSKFINFISNRDSICEGACLHCIGTCTVNSEGVIIDGSLQPFVIPYEIDFQRNFVSRLFVLSEFYRNIVTKYLEKLLKIKKGEKNGTKCK